MFVCRKELGKKREQSVDHLLDAIIV